ncbi:hypothetical protein SAMN04488540_10227 [Ferrimonas sediminum]|uniref:SPW repeat-containing protein n=1 Tax=Ferrimonas sediminum TaxID=718193 RepID=A0A1G8LD75_9GAMM|nr:hypothetical protein [Ferrimonas sediminum]SDI53669.1 hypothetical protein SAMN04488540_10227 [Ferrimonas sediminum]
MNKKIVAVILALASAFFWYQPFNSFAGFYQTGEHWGGVAYGLMVLPVLFAIAIWARQKALAVVFSVATLLLAGKYILDIGDNVGWGLMGIAACAVASVLLSAGVKTR